MTFHRKMLGFLLPRNELKHLERMETFWNRLKLAETVSSVPVSFPETIETFQKHS